MHSNSSRCLLPFVLVFLFATNATFAANIEQIQAVVETKLDEAKASQGKIDEIISGAQDRLIQYRSLLKQIDGLKTYNAQLSTQVTSQENLIQKFDQSISQVSLIERQISPLVIKMVDSLRQFISLDLPFHSEERAERIALIEDSLAVADINIAERFRQIIEAYQIENEYGRKIASYQDIVMIDGTQQEVDVLHIGRVALICQTKDTRLSAFWDKNRGAWQALDNATYRNAIRKGIKMAKKQASIDLLTLPIVLSGVAE